VRSILLIGADGVIPFLRGLEQDGFEVTIHRPGDPDAPDAEYDVVIVDLSSAGEDATGPSVWRNHRSAPVRFAARSP